MTVLSSKPRPFYHVPVPQVALAVQHFWLLTRTDKPERARARMVLARPSQDTLALHECHERTLHRWGGRNTHTVLAGSSSFQPTIPRVLA
jgi:hypothetical protein